MMWDERFAQPGFAYGTEPNDFLREVVSTIPKGKVLSLAEGEGRNGVFLAQQGYDVTGVDSSKVGLAKAENLAKERGVTISTVVTDLAAYEIAPAAWSGIVSIFCHLPPPARSRLYRQAVAGLKPGGVLVLEAYTPKQLEFKTGGPPVAELMPTLAELKTELAGLQFEIAREIEREIHEGKLHDGKSAVVQILARKV
jgi:SAM-dependent methyltransferase